MAGERRYIGISEEATFGVATDAAFYLDFLSANLDAPSEPLLFFEGAGSRGAPLVVPGPYTASGDLEIAVDPVQAIHFMKWAMGLYGRQGTDDTPPKTTLTADASAGNDAISVGDESNFAVDDYVQVNQGIYGDVVKIVALDSDSTDPYTWEITPLMHNQGTGNDVKRVEAPFTHMFQPTKGGNLPSFTVRVGKDFFEHVFTGATVDRLAFSVDRGILTCTVSIQAQKDFKGALNISPKTFPSNLLTFRQGTTFLDRVDISNSVESFALEVVNNIDAQAGVRMGSRFPREFPFGGVDVSGSLVLSFKNTDEYEKFWGAATGAVDQAPISFTLEQWFQSGSDRLKFILGSAYWTQVSTPVSGRDRMTQAVQFKTVEDSIWGAVHLEATNSRVSY